ncbi:MAG TPA: lamin tail domain-containing protein, partial [Chryseolinea sp.]|nr:lamin tail domain-containing protein [Chryseolinea sp.]
MNNILQIIRTCSITSIVLLLSQQLFAQLWFSTAFSSSQTGKPTSLDLLSFNDMISNPKIRDPAAHRHYQATSIPIGVKSIEANPSRGIEAVMESGWKSVVITEIFPDPTPSNGLPSYEYVEILNRSGSNIKLEEWQLRDESTGMVLPDVELASGNYMILSSEPGQFDAYGAALASVNFPTLNNVGDVIMLFNADGELIDSVRYRQSWYRDRDKSNGGWSLELIDPENGCGDQQNWIASEDPSGGTPGRKNSVYAEKPDVNPPILVSVQLLSDQLLRIRFNERLSNAVPETNCFEFNPPLKVDTITFTDQSLMLLDLLIVDRLQAGITYKVAVTGIQDCAGNAAQTYSQPMIFGKPEVAAMGDIVINEILFDPTPLGVDFIELLNTSGKFIDISNWSFGNY